MQLLLDVKQTDWLKVISDCVKNGKHKMGYIKTETPVVIVHKKSQVDEEICKNLGYEIIESYNNGGTIVSNKGDILLAHFDVCDNTWGVTFAEYFVNWLKNKNLNAEFTGNDVLVDGYKVCGACITRYGRVDYTGFAISVNINLDHIKQICRKPMVKVPKGLSDFGITSEEVEQMFIEFCEKNSK